MSEPMIELRDVVKQYDGGRAVLDGVDLRVECGRMLSIVGPSGCGKSTLLNLIGSLDSPTRGSVRVAGTDLAAHRPRELAAFRNETIGLIFQLHHLLPQCTAVENVLLPVLARRKATRKDLSRAEALLERVGLAAQSGQYPAELSGGERQRVAVARALINEPPVLLADEPTGQLDHRNADALAELLISLNRERGTTLVVATHAQELAKRMGESHLLRDGRLHKLTAGETAEDEA